MNKKITYKDAGVDIKKADEAIEMSKKEISSTFSKDVLSSIDMLCPGKISEVVSSIVSKISFLAKE